MEVAEHGIPVRTLPFSKALYIHHSARVQGQDSLTIGPIPVSLDYARHPTPSEDSCYADDVEYLLDSLTFTVGCVDCYRAMGQSVGNAVWCGQVWLSASLAFCHHALANHWISTSWTVGSFVWSHTVPWCADDSSVDHSTWLKQNRLHSSTPSRLIHPVLATPPLR
ncbi:hypothetical protein BASA60_003253 [Batrachochytrium salamandrivorans]|nr:hypothetical protein BASA60_003253 [Batrachochytrium salamandrivorans]